MKLQTFASFTVLPFVGLCETFLDPAETCLNPLTCERYFVFSQSVATGVRGQAFVVSTSDPQFIALMRLTAASWDYRHDHVPDVGDSVAFVKISAFNDSTNRNYLEPGAPQWSWSVGHLFGLGSFIIPGYDASPRDVEDDLEHWLLRGLGFDFYFAIGELPIQPHVVRKGSPWRTNVIFGDFNDAHYPWIIFETFGMNAVMGFDPFSIWMYSEVMESWFWTAEDVFPWGWRPSDGSWIRLLPPGTIQLETEVAVYNLVTSTWELY